MAHQVLAGDPRPQYAAEVVLQLSVGRDVGLGQALRVAEVEDDEGGGVPAAGPGDDGGARRQVRQRVECGAGAVKAVRQPEDGIEEVCYVGLDVPEVEQRSSLLRAGWLSLQ